MLAATVQGSREERLRRQQARIRDRGGIFKPGETTGDNPLLAKLLSRLEQTPAPLDIIPSKASSPARKNEPTRVSPRKHKLIKTNTTRKAAATAATFKANIKKVKATENAATSATPDRKGKGKARVSNIVMETTIIAEQLVPVRSPSRAATVVRRKKPVKPSQGPADDANVSVALSTMSALEKTPPKPKRARIAREKRKYEPQAGPSSVPSDPPRPLDDSSRPTRTRSRVRLATEVESISSGGTLRHSRTLFGPKAPPEPFDEPAVVEDAIINVDEDTVDVVEEESLSAVKRAHVGKRKRKERVNGVDNSEFGQDSEKIRPGEIVDEPAEKSESGKGRRLPTHTKPDDNNPRDSPEAMPAKRKTRRKVAEVIIEEANHEGVPPPAEKKKARKRKGTTEAETPMDIDEDKSPAKTKKRRTKAPALVDDTNISNGDLPPAKVTKTRTKSKENSTSRKSASRASSRPTARGKSKAPPEDILLLADKTLVADSDFDPLDVL